MATKTKATSAKTSAVKMENRRAATGRRGRGTPVVRSAARQRPEETAAGTPVAITPCPAGVAPVSEAAAAVTTEVQADQHQDVLFVYAAADEAQTVCVAGSFNAWTPAVHPLTRVSGTRFEARLCLPPGEYRYKFVVDGHWVEDPTAKAQVPNPFGTLDSLVQV